MNIIFVRKDIVLLEYMANVLSESEANVYAINTPENGNNRYLEEILMIKKEVGIDLLLSFDYYPEISLAAGALGIKYACIISANYDARIYDNTILNAWNYIFSADAIKIKKITEIGQANAFLLPFPCIEEQVASFDVFLKNNENSIEALYNKVSMLSPEIQGYLDGFMAICRQDNKQNEIFKYLSLPAREEIGASFSLKDAYSYETKAEYYDHNILIPILSDRSGDLFELVVKEEFGNLEDIKKAGIVISVPNRNAGTAASFEEWNAIANGEFLIASDVTDFSILGNATPVTYSDRFELIRTIKYYLENKEEREAYALKVKKAALSLNAIENYVSQIIERLSDE